MSATILPEFEAYARQQVEAGAYASEQDVIDAALKGHLAEIDALRASLAEAEAEADRDGWVDGETFLAELLADTEARAARHG